MALSSLPPLGGRQDWAAFVALDWADEKHAWCLLAEGAQQREQGWVVNTPETIQQWVECLQRRFADRPIAVCLEQSRGALVYALSKYPQLVLFPAPPIMVARLRKAFHPSGAKGDPGDSQLQLTLLLQHGDQLRALPTDTEQTRLLRLLVEARRRFVDERTRQKNRLTDCLKSYYPQMLNWFHDPSSATALGFLKQWPTLQLAQHAHPGALHRFFQHHRGRKPKFLENQAAAVYRAVPSTCDAAVTDALSLQATALAGLIESLHATIAGYDERSAAVLAAHPDTPIFASLPGAGPVMRARLLVALGSDRNRFQNASELQTMVGIAPVTSSSGKSHRVSVRRGCSKFLRQTFHEYAALSRMRSAWAAAYYSSQISAGKNHHAAVRALAFKWCRIIFRCWKDSTPYDERRYQQSLERRNSPLKNLANATTGFGWEQHGGFSKLAKKIS